jgi:23S rRNA (pseudouridine1915-N3)-methyltransferase
MTNIVANYKTFLVKIVVLAIGKTDESWIQEGIDKYSKRLKHYISFEFQIFPDLKNRKNLSENQQKEQEGRLILKQVQNTDLLILLDEKGKEFHSKGFSDFLQQKMNAGIKRLVFVIGGPYGFSAEVYAQATSKIALSKMTFSHQMIRPFFAEQIYRAFSILNNEPYHHQ